MRFQHDSMIVLNRIRHKEAIMGKPYPPELRERIIAAWQEGESHRALARRFRVSLKSVQRYLRTYREHGTVQPCKIGGHKRYKLKGYEDRLRGWLEAAPDMTLDRMQLRFREEYGVYVSRMTIHNFLRHLNISYKKRRSMRANSNART